MDFNLGERIKKARKDKKMTQTELAKLIGKAESSIRKYENGKVIPPLKVLYKIYRVLEINDNVLKLEQKEIKILQNPTTETKFKAGDFVSVNGIGRGIIVGFSSVSNNPIIFFYEEEKNICVAENEVIKF